MKNELKNHQKPYKTIKNHQKKSLKIQIFSYFTVFFRPADGLLTLRLSCFWLFLASENTKFEWKSAPQPPKIISLGRNTSEKLFWRMRNPYEGNR